MKFSTSAKYHEYIRGYLELISKEYHDSCRVHENTGGCSVHGKDFMSTVHQGAPMSTLRDIMIHIRGWKS